MRPEKDKAIIDYIFVRKTLDERKTISNVTVDRNFDRYEKMSIECFDTESNGANVRKSIVIVRPLIYNK